MKRTISNILLLLTLLVLSACSADEKGEEQSSRKLTISSEIDNFIGEGTTRVNVEGTEFLTNDMIRLKIICPYVTTTQLGESTWGNTADAFWLLKWTGGNWATLTSAENYDISGSYSYSGSTDLFGIYEAQATPYVYTASTWTEERLFRDKRANLVIQYCNVFHADQSRQKNYQASDIMWAQQFSQTGAWNIHLSFKHVMACLYITIDDDALDTKISDNAVLTIEGMPDIDQQEIVIGDYYAAKSKINSRYGYMQKVQCAYENNGLVLGIASIDENAQHAVVRPFSGGPDITGYGYPGSILLNNATYICHHIAGTKTYRLIVPPHVLIEKAVLWLRDGSRRYSMTLDRTTFEQGHLYNVKMKISQPALEEPTEEPTEEPQTPEGSGQNP